mmetsp:Transcript_9660/g.29091  ORF Transcript_9660/g.29091 Transcript_9660/m.29091 type:complete len:293 (-) Transcript_9660:553-1431(-)
MRSMATVRLRCTAPLCCTGTTTKVAASPASAAAANFAVSSSSPGTMVMGPDAESTRSAPTPAPTQHCTRHPTSAGSGEYWCRTAPLMSWGSPSPGRARSHCSCRESGGGPPAPWFTICRVPPTARLPLIERVRRTEGEVSDAGLPPPPRADMVGNFRGGEWRAGVPGSPPSAPSCDPSVASDWDILASRLATVSAASAARALSSCCSRSISLSRFASCSSRALHRCSSSDTRFSVPEASAEFAAVPASSLTVECPLEVAMAFSGMPSNWLPALVVAAALSASSLAAWAVLIS